MGNVRDQLLHLLLSLQALLLFALLYMMDTSQLLIDLAGQRILGLLVTFGRFPGKKRVQILLQLFCKRIYILFLTARDLEEDMLRGYELGAQDYVTKPFSMRVLLKKIDVILKREKKDAGQIFDDGFLYLDLLGARAEVNGKSCPVTPTEFRLLKEFIAHRGQLLTYDVLLDRLWEGGSQIVDRHALTVNIGRLRGKIEDEDHKYISNVYGMGYQWIG